MGLKIINGTTQLTPFPTRLGNLLDGINANDAVIFSQVFTNAGTYAGSNTYTGTNTFSGAIVSSLTTESTSTDTGAVKTAGGLGVVKNAQIGGQLAISKNIIRKMTPYTAAVDTTVGWTLTEVKNGLIAGCLKSTTAAAVTLTLDSVANIITAFAAAGVTIGAGTVLEFVTDNTTGSNGLTLAVDAGATIAVATPVITGGATLTCSTVNKLARYQLYLQSATVGILSRIV
jgi:hypothetical protein